MVKRLRILCLLGLVFMASRPDCRSQMTFSLVADSSEFITDTLPFSVLDTFRFYVVNSGFLSFSGMLNIRTKVNNGIADSLTLGNQTLAPGDSVLLNIVDSIFFPRYGGGINVVVIWPEVPGTAIVTDSFIKNVFVDSLINSNTPDFLRQVSWFPNPASQQVQINAGSQKGKIAGLWLMNSAGIIIRRWTELPESISVENNPPGIYHLIFICRDGRKYSGKIIVVR